MPCDTVATVQVKLDVKVTNKGLLDKAMASLGINSYTFNANGQVQFMDNGDGVSVADIKQAYSREVVKSQAARFGWRVSFNEKINKMTVLKARL